MPGVGTSRRLDYFIIDKALALAVKSVATISEFRCYSETADNIVAPKPQKAVTLELKQKLTPLTVRCLRLPRAFPRAKPVGCARAPVLPVADDTQTSVEDGCQLVSRSYASVVASVDEELSGVCDNFDDKQWGRAEGSSVATRPLLPRRAAGRRGAMPQKEYALV